MVAMEIKGKLRMCLVGGANKDSSGLDVRWDEGY